MLELKHVSWSASDGKEILHDISLTIGDNQIVAITGPNGGGKTSLARLLMGIEAPSSGQIFLDGRDITELDVTERAKLGISFAFQSPVRFKGITVRQMMETAAGEDLDKARICTLLQKVGLCAENYMDREIDATLSGGEIKRIELASVLARASRLTILDEPEAGIDLWSFEKLIQTFGDIRENMQGSMVIISHQERILEIADEIILIADGEISAQDRGDAMMSKLLANEDSEKKCCNRRDLFHEV